MLLSALISMAFTPVMLPALSYLITGTTIDLDVTGMMVFLLTYLILPIVAAQGVATYLPSVKQKLLPHAGSISVLLIFFIIAGPLAANAGLFLDVSWIELLSVVGMLFAVSGILFRMGRHSVPGGTREEKISSALSRGLMNISGATVVAAKFFSPAVLLVVLLYEFPRDVMMVPFKWIVEKVKR